MVARIAGGRIAPEGEETRRRMAEQVFARVSPADLVPPEGMACEAGLEELVRLKRAG